MIQVCCAVIKEKVKGEPCVLVCQRSATMRLPLKWEFPGGKVEQGEKLEECLIRELREELFIEVEVEKALSPVRHDYGSGLIELIPFFCRQLRGDIQLTEHKDYRWQPVSQLFELDFAEADIPIVHQLLKHERR